MAEQGWNPEDLDAAGRRDTGAIRVREILGRWYESSRHVLGWMFDSWYDEAAQAVGAALALGHLDVEALGALGAARAARGRTEQEALTDLAHALEANDGSTTIDRSAAGRALVSGFRGQTPRPSWFGDARALSRSLRHLYAERAGGDVAPAESHVLLAVDVDLSWLRGTERGTALVAACERLHQEFLFADPLACLGESRFAVVVHRHPGLAVGAETFRMWLESEILLARTTKVWLVPLPSGTAEIGRFVRDLSGAERPLRVGAYEPRAAAGGGAGAELLESVVPISAVGGERSHRRLLAAWADASSMVAAAVAVLMLAVGVGRMVGPAGLPVPTTGSGIFGLALAPPPSLEADSGSLALPAPAPEPEPAAVAVESVRAEVNVRGAVRTSATASPPVTSSPAASGPSSDAAPPPPAPPPAPPPSPAPVVEAVPAAPPPPIVVPADEEPWPPRDERSSGKGPKHADPRADDDDEKHGDDDEKHDKGD